MTPTVTVAGRAATPEEQAVLDAIECTGNPDDSKLQPTVIAQAMIMLADFNAPLIAVERLPVAGAGRDAWLGYARRLHLELPEQATIPSLQRTIGGHRLWTTVIPDAAVRPAA